MATIRSMFLTQGPVILLTLGLLLPANKMAAQSMNDKDSIWSLIQKAPDDTSSVLPYLYYAHIFIPVSKDTSIYYYNKAASIARHYKSLRHYLFYKQFLGDFYMYRNEFPNAISVFRECYAIAFRLNRTGQRARALSDIGGVYSLMGKMDSAIGYYKSALALWQTKKKNRTDSLELGGLYFQLCTLYQQQTMNKEAYYYAQKTYAIGRLLNEPEYEAFGLLGLASYEYTLKHWDKALEYLNAAGMLNDRAKNPVIMLNVAQVSGDVYIEQQKYANAEEEYKKLFSLSKQTSDPAATMFAAMGLTRIYTRSGRLKEAEKYYNESLKEAAANNRDLYMPQILNAGIELYKSLENYKKGFELMEELSALKEKMSSDELRKDFQKLTLQYQTLQKDKEISNSKLLLARQDTKLQEQSKILIAALLGLAIVLLAAVFVYIYYKQKQRFHTQLMKNMRQEKQVTVLEAMIQGEEKERTRIAKELHDGVGGMLSAVKMHFSTVKNEISDPRAKLKFMHALQLLDDTSGEVRKTSHNLMPEVLTRHGLHTALQLYCSNINAAGTLEIHYHSFGVHRRFNQSFELSVYRIVQELVNNIIKHSRATEAIVQLNEENDLLSVLVEDNGVGFKKSILESPHGIGLYNLRSRIIAMNGRMEVTTDEGQGTSIYVDFDLSQVSLTAGVSFAAN